MLEIKLEDNYSEPIERHALMIATRFSCQVYAKAQGYKGNVHAPKLKD